MHVERFFKDRLLQVIRYKTLSSLNKLASSSVYSGCHASLEATRGSEPLLAKEELIKRNGGFTVHISKHELVSKRPLSRTSHEYHEGALKRK